MIQALKEEFQGLSNNQVFELSFGKRLMRPDLSRPGYFLGNTHREDLLPFLNQLLNQVPEGAQIFDFGAGAGEIVNLALKQVKSATINMEEPNHLLLSKYVERLCAFPHLSPGLVHCGPIQDYYVADCRPPAPRPSLPQDLVMAIHMIYHLTDFRQGRIDPGQDIEQAVAVMYSLLKPGGHLFIAFSDNRVSTIGLAGRYYFRKKQRPDMVERLSNICESRARLLGQGEIVTFLDRTFPDSRAECNTITTDSCLYGVVREDIIAMCLVGELAEVNDECFDTEKLDILANFFDDREEGSELTVETRSVPQQGMWRASQPQIITSIRRQPRF